MSLQAIYNSIKKEKLKFFFTKQPKIKTQKTHREIEFFTAQPLFIHFLKK